MEEAREFVAEAKANPGKFRVGTPGEATSSHLNLEVLMHVAGVKFTTCRTADGANRHRLCSADISRRWSPSREK